MEDRQWYREMQKGNKAAFEQLFRLYYASLCRFASTFLHDPQQAEDIVQDRFFHLWLDREKIFIHTSVQAYLYSVVRNACLNHLKHLQVEARYGRSLQAEKTGQNALTEADAEEIREREEDLYRLVHQAVDAMPDKRKEVFKMVKMQGKSYKEVAHLLEISIKTVENQMGKALAYLRETLKHKLPLLAWLLLFSAGGIGVLMMMLVYIMK